MSGAFYSFEVTNAKFADWEHSCLGKYRVGARDTIIVLVFSG
jgi:hypothetical protein